MRKICFFFFKSKDYMFNSHFHLGNTCSKVKFSRILVDIRFNRRWSAFSTNGMISFETTSKFSLITPFTASPIVFQNNLLELIY